MDSENNNNNNIINNKKHDMFIAAEDSATKPFWFGFLGGIAAVLVSHPLDTIKLRFQTRTQANLLKNLYHGVTPNLLATPAAWSFNLFAYHTGLKLFDQITSKPLSNNSNSSDNTSNSVASVNMVKVTLSGIFAGFAWSVVVCPFEMVKCYSQRYHTPSHRSLFAIYKHLGVRYGVYRGILACLMRDMPVSGVYFTILETLRHNIPNYNDSNVLWPFLTGSMCGIAGCAVGLPGDCIKSHIQTNFVDEKVGSGIAGVSNNVNNAKIRYVLKDIVGKYGYIGLYRGGMVVVMREILGAGTAIMTMEYVNKYL